MVESHHQDAENIFDVLLKVKPFSSLDPETLRQLSQHAGKKVFPPNSFVFRQGEDSRKMLFVIAAGLAEITVRNEKNKESVAGYRRVGDFFGETVVLSNKTYPASVKALTNLDCILIRGEDFENLLENNASFASFFSKLVAERFRSLFHEVALEEGVFAAYEGHAALKRASELMSHPVISCSSKEKTNQLAMMMSANQISALVLTDESGLVCGLVTEKDLVEKVVANGIQPDSISAEEIANKNPVCIDPEDFYYQVLLSMIKEQAKHAIVTEGGKPVGIITVRDLIRSRNAGMISIISRMENQTDLNSLAQVGIEIDHVLKGLVAENAPVPEILDIISEFYDRLTRQVIEIALDEMYPDFGPPPVKFCWLTMGSSGRREQYLRTDQDNALVYQAPADELLVKKAERFFAHLADIVVQGLITCGFAPCPGFVMASNRLWRGDVNNWHRQVASWIKKPEKSNIRLLTIFLDFRPVYGFTPLAEELRQFTNNCFEKSPLTLRFLAEDCCQGRIPLGFLGNPVGEKSKKHRDEIDLKHSAAVFLVDSLRLSSIKIKSTATSSLERLQQLKTAGVLSSELAELLDTSFQTIMLLRLRSNLEKVRLGKPPDNYLNLTRLKNSEKILLKNSLKAIEKLVGTTRESFILY